MLTIILILIASYLIGSIPFALLVGKLGYGVDVRQHGSGNLGTTNTLRTLGKKAGVIVYLGDTGKGVLAASLPLIIGVDMNPLLAGVPAVIGHCYPIFANFRGGKAVATTAGILMLGNPILLGTTLLVFAVVLKWKKYVSLASIIASVYIHIYAIEFLDKSVSHATFLLCVLIFYRHRENIKRLVEGTESKIGKK